MTDNWVVETLNSSLEMWQHRLEEIGTLLTTSPESFRGGAIWRTITTIHGVVQGIGLGLLVLFFLVGVMKSCGTLLELKRPEVALRLFLRFAIAKGIITYGMELMMSLFKIGQGIIESICPRGIGFAEHLSIPSTIARVIEDCGFLESIPLWAVGLLCSCIVWILSLVLILTVYGRFFKLYMFTALSPIPLAAFAGEPTQSVGVSFLKSYCGVLLEGGLIALSCVIFTSFATTAPMVDTSKEAISMVWSYMGELIFNMLVLVGTVKASDRLVHEMLGL